MTDEPSKRHSLADGLDAARLKSPATLADVCKLYDTVTMVVLRANNELREAVSSLNARIDALEAGAISIDAARKRRA